MVSECSLGLSLRTDHQAAFEKVVVADATHQSSEVRTHLRQAALIVFDALQEHDEHCPICVGQHGVAHTRRNGMPNHEVTITPISRQNGISRYQITIVGDGALTTHGLYETLESALDSFEPSLSARVRSHIVEGVRGEGKAVMFCLEDSFET